VCVCVCVGVCVCVCVCVCVRACPSGRILLDASTEQMNTNFGCQWV